MRDSARLVRSHQQPHLSGRLHSAARATAANQLPALVPQPPAHQSKPRTIDAIISNSAGDDHDSDPARMSSARRWELQMHTAAGKVAKLNKKIQGGSYVELENTAELSLELERQKTKNRELRKANADLAHRAHTSEQARRQERDADALSDEDSETLHALEHRNWRRKLAQSDMVMLVLRAELHTLRGSVKELKIRQAGAKVPLDLLAQMRALNVEELRVQSARQAKELQRAQGELHSARTALLHRASPSGERASPNDTKEELQHMRAVLELEAAKSAELSADLFHSKEEQQRLVGEKENAKQEVSKNGDSCI